jgi:GMP synthase (glutamine-hydrolysing)
MPPLRRALILEHVAHEGPGQLAAIFARQGYQLEERRLYRGESVPSTLERGDFLVVMGGPMGVGDIADPRYPFLAQECALLKQAAAAHHPVLGICLGAQLIAHAAGAQVYPNAINGTHVLEVGWKPVTFTGANTREELAGLRDQEMMLHWHGDTFSLPPGAIHLGSTPECRNQAFRLARQVGLQFHPEVDEETIACWAHADAPYLQLANGEHAATRLRDDTARYAPAYRAIGERLLSNIVSALGQAGHSA